MPFPFTGCKMFSAGPNFLSQPKNWTAFSASSKTFVQAQKPILLKANPLFVLHKMFVTVTICKKNFGLAQKIWTSPKHFGTCKRTRHKGPKQFWSVQFVFDRSNSFWSGPNKFGKVQIIKISPEKCHLNQIKIIWTQPKQFWWSKIILFWTCGGTSYYCPDIYTVPS